jgi:hypothetical protein
MRFYDVTVNQSVPTEANRGLISYIEIVVLQAFFSPNDCNVKRLWKI